MTTPGGRFRSAVARGAAVIAAAGIVGVSGAASAEADAGTGSQPSIPAATQVLATTVGSGSLVISIPFAQVVLPPPALGPGGNRLTASGWLQPITVTDNRAGNPGWTLTGVLTGPAPGAAGIGGRNLGWDPSLVDESAGQRIVLGVKVNPAPAAGIGLLGLSQPRTLASTFAGSGLGTAHVGAQLLLDVPAAIKAGTYAATLTLTAI